MVEMNDIETRAPEHRTVSRTMGILEIAASESNGVRLADLATRMDAPKSSLHGLTRGLAATGYLREVDGRYVLGPAVMMLARSGQDLGATYRDALAQLSEEWGETAMLATLAGDTVINIESVEPDQHIRATPQLHVRRPIWPSSSGKVFLAYMDERRRGRILQRISKDAEDRARIVEVLQMVRDRGYGTSEGDVHPDLYAVSSPVMSGSADVNLAIAVSGPTFRMKDRLEAIADSVCDATRRLAAREF